MIMASYPHLGQHPNPQFQSPAKVFARLKSKVQREGTCANRGIATREEPPDNVQGVHGAEFTSPRKTPRGAQVEDALTGGRGTAHSRGEAKALTISPIPSPLNSLGCWNLGCSLAGDESLVPGGGRGYNPRPGECLESTALHQAQFLVGRKQSHEESPRSRAVAGFGASNKTPVTSAGKDCVFKKEHAFQISPSSVFSPIKNRLRKRKLAPWDLNNVSSSTKIHGESGRQPPGDETWGRSRAEDCVVVEKNLAHGPGFPAVPPDIGHFPQGPLIPSSTVTKRHCNVVLEKCPIMSPAKMFAYMKKREIGAGRRACNSTGDRFNGDGSHRSGGTPPAEAHAATGAESAAAGGAGRGPPVCEDGASAMGSSEDVCAPLVFTQPVLLEDPLILHSPRFTIPKKKKKEEEEEEALKHSWPQPPKVSSEKVIHLKEWSLKHNKKGLYVEGIHREEDILWNSNVIAERVSPYVVKTVTGRVYVLLGKMTLPVDSNFPRSFLKKFLNGFPPKWSKMYEEFLSEPRIHSKDTEKRNGARGNKAKSEASNNVPLKNQRKNISKTPDDCPPSSCSSTTMSRSGRVIKPPLEFWKGGRVTLDAQMNVTIHECYDKSICNPEEDDTAAASPRNRQKSLFPERRCDKVASVPQRSAKAPPRRRNKGTSKRREMLSQSPDGPLESLGVSAKGTSRWRSGQSRQTMESTLPAEPEPQWNAGKPRGPTGKRAVPPSRTSPDSNDASQQTSDGGSKVRARRSNRQHKKRGEGSFELQRLEESRTEKRERGGAKKDDNRTISKPANMKSSTTGKKAKVQRGSAQIRAAEDDEDKWTEEELAILQEAVSLYPKHKANYWAKVARLVGTRSAEDCYNQHTFQGASQSPFTKEKKREKKQPEAPKGPDNPVISARVGTFKRKQQVRHFLETMPKENVDDVFSCSYMQNRRVQIPSTYESNLSDDPDITLRNLEPVTPMSACFSEVKTPQCLHITPGMMGSPSRSNDDKYVFQLQKRMKKRQFNVYKKASAHKSFTPTPSVKRTMRRCDNAGQDTFVVWEMFPGNERALSDSEEEEDYYFSDNDCT